MVIEADNADTKKPRGKNIVIFSDGTGQRGGVYFDEARTNIYKLFRATRVSPDTCTDPAQQVAFYDPGLGTQATDGEAVSRAYRTAYNFVSQATGLGITRNAARILPASNGAIKRKSGPGKGRSTTSSRSGSPATTPISAAATRRTNAGCRTSLWPGWSMKPRGSGTTS